MVEIWETKTTKEQVMGLPIIILLVMYHGETNWRTPTNLGDLLIGYDAFPEDLKVYAPNFDYLLYDVSGYTDDDIKGEAQTRILLTLLRDIFTKDREKLQGSVLRSFHY